MNFGGEYPTWSEDRGHTWQDIGPRYSLSWGAWNPSQQYLDRRDLEREV